MSEIVQRTDTPTFVNPLSGEQLTLDSPTGDLGRYLADIRDFEGQIREVKRAVTREILARQDRAAQWTTHEPGVTIRGQSPAPTESWDGADLLAALHSLVARGVISIEAADAAVETVVTYRPVKKGISALRKLGGEVAETIERLCVRSEPERRVSISRSGL